MTSFLSVKNSQPFSISLFLSHKHTHSPSLFNTNIYTYAFTEIRDVEIANESSFRENVRFFLYVMISVSSFYCKVRKRTLFQNLCLLLEYNTRMNIHTIVHKRDKDFLLREVNVTWLMLQWLFKLLNTQLTLSYSMI